MENTNQSKYSMSGAKPATFLGNPEKTAKAGLYALKKPARVGQPSFFTCPQCGKPVVVMAEAAGISRKSCKACGTQVVIKVVEKPAPKPKAQAEATQQEAEKPKAQAAAARQEEKKPKEKAKKKPTESFGDRNNYKARLVWGGLFARKAYLLKEGENWIGRKDDKAKSGVQADAKSEVLIKDDFMSRRSVCITVTRSDKGYFFKLEVVKATNPVKVNGKVLNEGDSVFLNYEDYIVMGKTTLFVKKVKS